MCIDIVKLEISLSILILYDIYIYEPEASLFVCMSTDSQFKNWDRDIVEPETKRGKMVFNVMLKKDVT